MVLKRFVYPASTPLNPSPLRLLSHLQFYPSRFSTPSVYSNFLFSLSLHIYFLALRIEKENFHPWMDETFRDAKYAILFKKVH